MRRRQVDSCFTQTGACGWLLPAASCGTYSCLCNAYETATSADISACINCEQYVNATLAAGLLATEQYCLSNNDKCFGSSGACAWLYNLAPCSPTDLACNCRIFDALTSNEISSCISCEQSQDQALATAVLQLEQHCNPSYVFSSYVTRLI